MKTILYRYARRVQERTSGVFDSNQVPVAGDVEATFGLTYMGEDGNRLSMDIYRPKNAGSKKLPVILMIHGGGLFVGDSLMEAGVCQILAQKGYLVFSLSYRLLTEADACGEIADVCAGFRHVEKLLPDYNGCAEQVYVAAESAGAFLSVYTIALHASDILRNKIGCRASNLSIKKLVCFSGMFYTRKLDLIGALYPQQIFGKKIFDREFMALMNPENPEVIGRLPPVLLVSSDADFLKKYTLAYDTALTKAGIRPRYLADSGIMRGIKR